MRTIDLRSDTVTRPTPEMRRVMAEAEVGDDVYGEDPSVLRLEETAAQRLGMEAALFVPSGTMANQVALRSLSRPGDLVLASTHAHLLEYESGAAAALSGLQVKTLGRDGLFDGADLRGAVTPSNDHYPITRVAAIENTHNRAGGRVFPLELAKDVAAAARETGLALHLDGARLFNAEVATGTPAREWASLCDTVSFCLSKGLGAPVGSLVCSSRERWPALHRARKLLGGGMRQAGILAAAGLHALEHHVDRLAQDHANARRLAEGLERLEIPLVTAPETNMVVFSMRDAEGFVRAARERSLLINPVAPGRFRAVTHLDVDTSDIDDALGRIAEITATGIR
jgi:threonine aldolase